MADAVPSYGVVNRDILLSQDGMSFLSKIVAGEYPHPPISETLHFWLTEVQSERALFEGEPGLLHYNPLGVIHAGYAGTMLDSAMFCSVLTTLKQGEAMTTLELKLNLVRPLLKETGHIRAEGRVIHRGRTTATAEGYLRDAAGKLYAHATTTCAIFPAAG